MLIAGVDIGNSTTEVCIGYVKPDGIEFLSSAMTDTTGVKGSTDNVVGIVRALNAAFEKTGKSISDLSLIRINEASPVISDLALETLTETFLDSSVLGHNPDTPSGEGIALGDTIAIEQVFSAPAGEYVVIVPKEIDYEQAACLINASQEKVVGAIVQADEAVLIQNRIAQKIPIIDEVRMIEKIPMGCRAAIEVAPLGQVISKLQNPYGLANLFNLSAAETSSMIATAKCLIGTRSAVVIHSQDLKAEEKAMNAGSLTFFYKDKPPTTISLSKGEDKIMAAVEDSIDIQGELNTPVGKLIEGVKASTSNLVSDILVLDALVPVKVTGGMSGEVSYEKASAIAVMVGAEKLALDTLTMGIFEATGVKAEVAGVEGVMAVIGALTTQGTKLPLAVLDMGGGSTDFSLCNENGEVKTLHLAGAGKFVTMLIDKELGLNNLSLAEDIKRYPLAKVESLFSIRSETGQLKFFEQPLKPSLFGRTVILRDEPVPLDVKFSMERIVEVRRGAKRRVFVRNCLRALRKVSKEDNFNDIRQIVLVGGSSLDFEVPGLILQELAQYGIVVGMGEIRRTEGPRNAVATGLVLSMIGGET